jgi:hypothetical protein
VGNPVHTDHNDHDNVSQPHQDVPHSDEVTPHFDCSDHNHVDGIFIDETTHGDHTDHSHVAHADHDDHAKLLPRRPEALRKPLTHS